MASGTARIEMREIPDRGTGLCSTEAVVASCALGTHGAALFAVEHRLPVGTGSKRRLE
jgi:hypothetical protein